ncbi:hypothetical protein IW262DRAFT_660514 [Armillaria fumosa]|nr:hypothetical protein IW262DRAFT_660514 [Armillaria fumosa]
MSSIPSIPIPINDIPNKLATTLGALFVGATIASVCFGITLLQTVIYYKLNPNDPWIFRYSVALLLIFDALHVALSTHGLYFYLIQSFGNYLALLSKELSGNGLSSPHLLVMTMNLLAQLAAASD